MARKRKKKEKKETQAKTRKTKRKKREINIDAWIDKYIMDFVSLTGLDILGLTKEQYKELLSDILIELYGSLTSYSNVKVIAKRYLRARDKINEVIAARLAFMLNELTPEQLEFIAFNVDVNTALSVIPRIYRFLRKLGRNDLLDILRVKWRNSWLKKKYGVLPPQCPYCGFNSLMPDLTCLVCGALVSEKDIIESKEFRVKFMELIQGLDCTELRALLKHDIILYNDNEVKPPTQGRLPIDVEVYIPQSLKNIIRSELREKCEG